MKKGIANSTGIKTVSARRVKQNLKQDFTYRSSERDNALTPRDAQAPIKEASTSQGKKKKVVRNVARDNLTSRSQFWIQAVISLSGAHELTKGYLHNVRNRSESEAKIYLDAMGMDDEVKRKDRTSQYLAQSLAPVVANMLDNGASRLKFNSTKHRLVPKLQNGVLYTFWSPLIKMKGLTGSGGKGVVGARTSLSKTNAELGDTAAFPYIQAKIVNWNRANVQWYLSDHTGLNRPDEATGGKISLGHLVKYFTHLERWINNQKAALALQLDQVKKNGAIKGPALDYYEKVGKEIERHLSKFLDASQHIGHELFQASNTKNIPAKRKHLYIALKRLKGFSSAYEEFNRILPKGLHFGPLGR